MEFEDERNLIKYVKSEKGIWEVRGRRNTHLLGVQWNAVAKKMKMDSKHERYLIF